MKIGVRLAMGFAVVLVLLVLVAYVGIMSMQKMQESTNHIVKANYSRIETLTHLKDNIDNAYQSIANIALTGDRKSMLEEKKIVGDMRETYPVLIKAFEDANNHKETAEMMEKIKKDLEDAREGNTRVVDLALAGKGAEANSVYANVTEPLHHKINDDLGKIVSFEEERIKTRYEEANASFHSNMKLILIIGAAAICIVMALSMLLSRGISKPLSTTIALANKVAAGDLSSQLKITSKDEIGELGSAINKMIDSLKDMVNTVNQTAAQVASAADQVNSGAMSITKGAQSQASAAEETSSSMEEMAASIQTVAQNAGMLATNVDETSASINQMVASIEQVAKNSDAMASSVSETSATIEQMTVSIDRVARDTDTLSASVEETSATVEQMVASIDQVAKNADVLSSTVGETSSTIEEMAASIKQVARNVSEADQISQKAAVEAKAGSEAVELTIEGINRISDSMSLTSKAMESLGRRSDEIGKIVEVIEEIADQTNLLALNAAIEAARAGDAGRGFAVVADEVRKLAERSVVATKEISEVIKLVQKETDQAVKTTEMGASETREGIKLADKAGAALKRILDSVNSTNVLMSQINNASDQQANAAAQVLRSVENMNQATDQVTTAVKEQAMGTNQIRKAVDNMNRVSQQLAEATKEQAVGGKQIRVAVEDMNRVTGQVGIATKEQAAGSAQILKAVENMNSMTQQVANATSEQKRGGELVVKAVENISDIARDNLTSVQQMSKAAENLTFQAETLQRAISVFKTAEITTNCWDILHCAMEFRTKCPAYQNPEKRCWLINGTWCKGVLQGDARSKLANCMHCQAFKVMQGVNYLPSSTGKAIGSGSQA